MSEEPTPHHFRPSTVIEAEEIVKEEMRSHAYKDTPGMLDTFFGEEEIPSKFVDAVYEDLIRIKAYSPKGRSPGWKDLPRNPKDERGLYKPLVKVFRLITAQCVTTIKNLSDPDPSSHKKGRRKGKGKGKGRMQVDPAPSQPALSPPSWMPSVTFGSVVWRDEHDKPLNTTDQHSSAIKPDIVATFKAAYEKSEVWWRSVHVPLEVKKYNRPDAAAVQLFRYVRQALREQPDRRFMYGLVYAGASLTVWHIDHSGAFAAKPINVHQNPKDFIRVVLGFILKKPEDLGWDPTLLLFREGKESKPSYMVDPNENPEAARNAYDTMWVLETDEPLRREGTSPSDTDSARPSSWNITPVTPSTERPTERFVLYRAVSLSRAEVIRGRATRVWRAWKWEDMHLPRKERPIYAVKDTWQDARRAVEGDLYLTAMLNHQNNGGPPMTGVAKMYSHGVVRIDGHDDTTSVAIRRSVKLAGKALNLKTIQSLTQLLRQGSPDDQHTHRPCPIGDFFTDEAGDDYPTPANRIHTRLIMAAAGWSLLRFRNLPELFGGVHDAIIGHKWLRDNGILHRDISYNNILLTGRGAPNRAMMIDLDNAIIFDGHKTLAEDERSVGTLSFMSYEVLTSAHYFPARRLNDEGLSDASDSDSDSDGTASAKFDDQVRHNFVHDLESYMWVLCWIGLCRDGPGKSRSRDSIPVGQRKDYDRYLLEDFERTNPGDIARAKHDLMADRKKFKARVMAMFSPYFLRPLRRPMRSLHAALNVAYKKREYNLQLYGSFLTAFEDAASSEANLKWHKGEEHKHFEEMEEEVIAQREDDAGTFDSPHPSPSKAPSPPFPTAAPSTPRTPKASSSQLEYSSPLTPLPSTPSKKRTFSEFHKGALPSVEEESEEEEEGVLPTLGVYQEEEESPSPRKRRRSSRLEER